MKKTFIFYSLFFSILLLSSCHCVNEKLENNNKESSYKQNESLVDNSIQNADSEGQSFFESLLFDSSKLSSTSHSESICDLDLLSIEPMILSKDNMVDITISFGNESLKKVDVVDGKEVNSSLLGDYKWELEVLIDDVWYNVMGDLEKFIPDEYSENLGLLFAVPTIEVYLDHVNTWTIPTGTVLSGLPVGRYRVVKNVDGWKYAEFVIE